MSFPTITSLSNERIKAAVRLRRSSHRREESRTLVDGLCELSAAVAAGTVVEEVFFAPALLGNDAKPLLSDLAQRGAVVFEVSEPVLAKLAYGSRTEGIVAVVVRPRRTLEEIALPDCPLVAVLEGIEKPGNIGAVVRSADAAGVSAVIVADSATDLYNPNAIRASLGTIFRVPVVAAEGPAVLAWLRAKGLQILATRVDGQVHPWNVDLTKPTALILGAEATGLSPLWSAPDITPVRLPMLGGADSLNVSATAAVLFYEAVRQRQDTS